MDKDEPTRWYSTTWIYSQHNLHAQGVTVSTHNDVQTNRETSTDPYWALQTNQSIERGTSPLWKSSICFNPSSEDYARRRIQEPTRCPYATHNNTDKRSRKSHEGKPIDKGTTGWIHTTSATEIK